MWCVESLRSWFVCRELLKSFVISGLPGLWELKYRNLITSVIVFVVTFLWFGRFCCTHDPAPIGGTSSFNSRMCDFDNAASTLHSEQTLCSNPAVSNMHTVIYSLFTISHRLSGGTIFTTPQTPYDWLPYGLASPTDAYARGLRRMLASSPLTS